VERKMLSMEKQGYELSWHAEFQPATLAISHLSLASEMIVSLFMRLSLMPLAESARVMLESTHISMEMEKKNAQHGEARI
jgi:hypothetical protein